MRTFKQYLQEKYNRVKECMVTSFGSHSLNEDSYEVKTDAEHDALHEKLRINKHLIDPTHLGAVTRYSDSSWELNNYLHKRSKGPVEAEHFPQEANMLTGVLNVHKTKMPIDLYTGIKYSPAKHFEDDAELPESKVVHLPGFTSTSTKRSVAGRFSGNVVHNDDERHGVNSEYGAKHIIHIHAPKGTSAASIKEYSFMPHEEEVLLNRGHNIMLESKPEHLGDNVYQWNARIVSHEPQKL